VVLCGFLWTSLLNRFSRAEGTSFLPRLRVFCRPTCCPHVRALISSPGSSSSECRRFFLSLNGPVLVLDFSLRLTLLSLFSQPARCFLCKDVFDVSCSAPRGPLGPSTQDRAEAFFLLTLCIAWSGLLTRPVSALVKNMLKC
jgi:hypothetical protein